MEAIASRLEAIATSNKGIAMVSGSWEQQQTHVVDHTTCVQRRMVGLFPMSTAVKTAVKKGSAASHVQPPSTNFFLLSSSPSTSSLRYKNQLRAFACLDGVSERDVHFRY